MGLIRALRGASGVAHYFDGGRDGDYFAKDRSQSGEIPDSRWYGKAAESLGLTGQIKAVDFELMLNRVLPNGQDLSKNGGRQTDTGSQRTGHDFIVSMP